VNAQHGAGQEAGAWNPKGPQSMLSRTSVPRFARPPGEAVDEQVEQQLEASILVGFAVSEEEVAEL
jgi:hypothetical protein